MAICWFLTKASNSKRQRMHTSSISLQVVLIQFLIYFCTLKLVHTKNRTLYMFHPAFVSLWIWPGVENRSSWSTRGDQQENRSSWTTSTSSRQNSRAKVSKRFGRRATSPDTDIHFKLNKFTCKWITCALQVLPAGQVEGSCCGPHLV